MEPVVDTSIDRPWHVRGVLYLTAAALSIIPNIVNPSMATVATSALAVGGVVTSVWDRSVPTPRWRVQVMAAYDLAMTLALAALGMPGVSLLVMVATTAILSLGQPEHRRWFGLLAGFMGAGIAYLSVVVAGIDGLAAFEGRFEVLGWAVLISLFGVISGGMAWMFGAVGHRMHNLARTEEALVRTRRELDLLFDRIPAALYRSTPTGEVIAANPALASLLGLSDPEDLLGAVAKAHAHYYDPEGRKAWLDMFENQDVVMDFEMELSKADGTQIIVTDSARAIRDAQGEIQFFEGVLLDVTAQREVERARQRTAEILEATSDLVLITDETNAIQRVNASMRRFLDGEDSLFRGKHIDTFILDRADAAAFRAWREGAHDVRVWSGELELRSPRGTEILTSAVAQHHSNFVSLVARDITTERRTAGQLERLVEAKDEFIASVSHELRTPLTAVLGLAAELSESYDELDEATKQEFIRLVADQAAEVAAIVDDLLVAARADTGSVTLMREPVDVRWAVEGVLAALPGARDAVFEVTGDGIASGDPQRIRQIIRNLLTNAVRYGELPGRVDITRDGDHVAVAVSDKGPGIAPEMADRIFEPYERAHSVATQPNSVGLGLSVSRWLAEKMGGSLVYENDGMSTFRLRLPIA